MRDVAHGPLVKLLLSLVSIADDFNHTNIFKMLLSCVSIIIFLNVKLQWGNYKILVNTILDILC